MKAILTKSEIGIVNSTYKYNSSMVYLPHGLPTTHQEFTIYGKDIEFDVKMISKNEFIIPHDCEVDAEIKFTFTPKTPKSETITLK